MFARCLLAAVVLTAAVSAADPVLPDGKHVLLVTRNAATEERLALLEVKGADVKVTDGGPMKAELSDWKVADGLVTASVSTATTKYKFEGKADAKGKRVLGTLSNDTVTIRAVVASSELKELTAETRFSPVAGLPDDLKELSKLQNAPLQLRFQAQQEKDADKKKELIEKAKEATAKATTEGPKLLKKVVEADTTDVGVLYFAGIDLLAQATAMKADPKDVSKWADKAIAAAAAHGPKAEANAIGNVAEALAAQADFAAVALPFAEKAVAATDKAPTAKKVRALKALLTAQTKAGKADAAKATLAAVDKIEGELDTEYKKAGPGFTPTKYEGRKDKDANKVVVFEMFTGAMCPPCVAADLAFDGLESAYTAKELVLLQYHQHIPGPDPLTNPDTVGRWGYYSKLFPKEIRGVPSSVFGGKPAAGGGGGKPNAEKKFKDYREVIDKMLEEKTDVTVSGTATLTDGTLNVDATVGGKAADGATVRVILAEEEVRYLGGNGIRLHHQVVRSLFGKVDGWKVKDLKAGKATTSVKLDDVKKGLAEYMDNFHKTERPFSNPDRPLKFEHLKVIVIVQDDETGEILQAVQLDVGGKKS